MENFTLFLGFTILLFTLGVHSARPISCIEQFYKNLVWYDNELDIISKKPQLKNEEQLTEKCSSLALLIARVVQSGCQLSAIQLSELGQRQRNLQAAGMTSCWAVRPYPLTFLHTNQTVVLPLTSAPVNPYGTAAAAASQPPAQAVGSRNIYESLNPCDVKVRNCYLQFQVNLMMRSGYRNQTCAIIESFAKCLLALTECGFSELHRPLIVKEAVSQVQFRFWESKKCSLDTQISAAGSTYTTVNIFRNTTVTTPPAVTSRTQTKTTALYLKYAPQGCGRANFRCGNGNCVSVDQICNAVDNCGDASDEIGCQTREKNITREIEQTFAKYACYEVMPNCTLLHITPVLLSVQRGQQPEPDTLCKASNKVFQCAVYESCPLSGEDRVKITTLLVQSFEQIVSRRTCQLVTDNLEKTNYTSPRNTTNTPSTSNTINITKAPNITNMTINTSNTNLTNNINSTNSTRTTDVNKANIINSATNLISNRNTTSLSGNRNINVAITTMGTTNSSNITSSCVRSCKGIQSGNYHSCSGCNVYATCVEGVLYDNRPCSAKLLWDDRSKRCEVRSTTCQAPNDCVLSCIGLPSGDYQSCKGCGVYVTCNNGIILDNRPCPENLVWNDVNKRCELNSTTCKSTREKSKSFNCVKSCKGLASDHYQSCLGCSVYVTCNNGILTENRPCPNFTVWDDAVKRCESVSTTCRVN